MGQALYRKYRSKNLDELVGQQHITETLKKAVAAGRISHAYLFTGPRGIGKTSTARILAHDINGLPYDESQTHIDIIEIDAASNRRIDEIRDIRDRVSIAPAQAKYKVYIIDEVHMLTKEAFNALLKTLEEPPAHVVFILATTEVHKLPATIISRTQRYSFKPAGRNVVAAHLKQIADAENIVVEANALDAIADYGQGSFRDSISLLDQAAGSEKPISLQMVQDILGIASEAAIADIVLAIQNGNKLAVVEYLQALFATGHAAGQLASQLAEALRADVLAERPVLATTICLNLLGELLEVPASHNPERALEVALLRAAIIPTATTAQPPAAIVAVQPAIVRPVVDTPAPAILSKPVMVMPETPAPASAADDQPTGTDTFDLGQWPAVLEAFRQKYNTLYSILNKAKPSINEGTLELCVDFPFHQKRLNETKNKKIIYDVIAATTGLNVSFNCTVKERVAPPVAVTGEPEPKPKADDISTVNNIFGTGEMLS